MLNNDDALHASYSRNMSRETIRKNLIKLAKDKGIQDPEVWPHGDNWAMRYTSRDGEPRQVILGNVFAKARGAILSLAGTASKHNDRGVGQRLQQFADSAGFDGGQVRFIGKQYVLFYKGKQLPLGPAGRAIGELRRLAGVLLSLAGTSQASQIGALKKKFPGITFTPTPDGRIKARGDNVMIVGKDINDVIKQLKGKQLSRNSTEDSKGRPINEGDKVQISKQYGGGTAVVKAVMNGFVQLSNGKSYSSSDVTVIKAATMSLETQRVMVGSAYRWNGPAGRADVKVTKVYKDNSNGGIPTWWVEFTQAGKKRRLAQRVFLAKAGQKIN